MHLPIRKLAALTLVAAPLGFLACGGGETKPATPSSGHQSVTRAIASAVNGSATPGATSGGGGIDRAAMDTSVSPCDDFYQYACGNWIKAATIPDDEATWFRSFSVIRDRNEETLHQILESLAKGESTGSKYEKELGDFYASCVDEDAIEKLDTKPIAPWLTAIDQAKDAKALTQLIGKLQANGLPMLFEISAAQDFGDATKVVAMLWQGGLGMPEREYYLESNAKMTEMRGKYEKHVGAMFKLAGEPEAKAAAAAKTILKIETALANAWMTKEDRREPKKIHHAAARADLAKMVPGFGWDSWLDGLGAKDVAAFNVGQPEYFKAVAQMLGGKVSLAEWKTYFRWHVLRSNADDLPKRFVEEKLEWRKAIVGVAKVPARWKRCVRAVDGAMGEALAQPFVKKTLGAEGKANVVAMVRAIEAAMHENLEKLPWMDDATRKAAFTKLGKVANKIAYPDKWRSYDGLAIDRHEYLANRTRGAAFEVRRQLAKIGKPVDRTEWLMSPPTVNAYYDAQMNEMVFPAGILQPPFYSNASAAPINFGGIGMVMGHELTHGFDDEGRQFDAEGNLRDWWSASVNAEFEKRAECVKKQFDEYTVLGDLHVNGKLTLGENIADLGGLKLAYKAAPTKGPASQEFFLGFAQGWCGKMRDEALRHLVATNPHSPSSLRVNGPLSNLPEFAQAFQCKPDAKMVRKERCEVW